MNSVLSIIHSGTGKQLAVPHKSREKMGNGNGPARGAAAGDLPYLCASPGHLIRRLQQIVVSIYAEDAKEFGITVVQYAALAAIRSNPGIDQRRLARVIGIDRSTIGSVVQRLQRGRYLTRVTARRDRRFKELVLTASGAALLRRMSPIVKGVQVKLLSVLSPGDRTEFGRLLKELVDKNIKRSRVPFELHLVDAA